MAKVEIELVAEVLKDNELDPAVVDRIVRQIEPLVAEHRDRIHLVPAHITDAQAIRNLMRDAAAVVSILPSPLLPAISRIAVEERHVFTCAMATARSSGLHQ